MEQESKTANTVTFFIATARSGTQWLADQLQSSYPDCLVARHEPIQYAYKPRSTLRNEAQLLALRDDSKVAHHLDWIHRQLEEQSYVETGFPAYTLAPLLRSEFGSKLRLVHLTRQPAPVAASLVTHGWYQDRRQDITGWVAPVPTDANVSFATRANLWPLMTAFEKALFYWLEVHRFGFEQEEMSRRGSFARFKFEQLIAEPAARAALARFLDLPDREAWHSASARKVDKHVRRTAERLNWDAVERFPEIAEMASRLGYVPAQLDVSLLEARYREPLPQRTAISLRRRMAAAALLISPYLPGETNPSKFRRRSIDPDHCEGGPR